MNKFYLFIATCFAATAIIACNSAGGDKQQEKKQLDVILQLHDKMMDKDELVLTNKSKLDTLLKKYPNDAAKTEKIPGLIKQINAADDAMQNWMHKFNADYTGKSHQEVMEYLHSQQRQITTVDSMLNLAADTSTKFLSEVK